MPNSAKSSEPVHTRNEVAKIAGVSGDTIRKAKVIVREADKPTKAALRQGERSIHRVYQELRPSHGSPEAAPSGPPVRRIEAPLIIPDPFARAPVLEDPDREEARHEVMRQWFRTLQELLVHVQRLEGDGLDDILAVASEEEFPQVLALLTALRDRLTAVIRTTEGLSGKLIDLRGGGGHTNGQPNRATDNDC